MSELKLSERGHTTREAVAKRGTRLRQRRT